MTDSYYPFAGDRHFVRNAWYVAGWSDEFGATPVARTILGEPLVIYRDSSGEVRALEGLCPHRQFPLAQAWVEGDCLRCPYHGMRFGPDGRCTEIPSQATIPEAAHLRAFPVVERWRWVWVWMGDPATADPALIPDHEAAGLSDANDATPCSRLEIDARYQLLNENLLDLTHITFLHQGGAAGVWVEGTDWPDETIETDPDGRWLRGARTFALPATDLPPAAGLDGGPAEMELTMDYRLPGFFVGRQVYRSTLPGKHNVSAGFINVHFFTPVDAHRTVYYFATARTFANGDTATTEALLERFRKVLDEDKFAAEAIEPWLDRPGRRPDFVRRADRAAILGRRMIQRLLDAEAGA